MSQGFTQYEGELVDRKRVFYTGTDQLTMGYLLCFDADLGTAGDFERTRAMHVEKPSATNLKNFAGVVAPESSGKTGPAYIDLFVPLRRGQKINIFTDQSVTVDTTVLTVQAGSYAAGGVGEGITIGKAMQTVDRSSTNGTCQAILFGVNPSETASTMAAGASSPSPLIWDQIPWAEIDNDPSIGFKYFNDYMGEIDVTTADGYVITAVTTGAIAPIATEQGGVLLVDSAGSTTADDGVNVQLTNCMVKPAAGVKIAFEARVKMNDATDQYFIGLAGVDVTLIAAGVVDDTVDKAGFFHHAASTDDKISSITARTSAEDITADVAANADNTYVTLGLVINGVTSVEFYVNGVLVETGTTGANIPNAVMCLSYVSQIEGTGTDAELSVDWVRIAQIGGRG